VEKRNGGRYIPPALGNGQRLRQLEHSMAVSYGLVHIHHVAYIPNVMYMSRDDIMSRRYVAFRREQSVKSRRDEYTEATRQALLSAGRDIFAREGFQASGIEAISRRRG